MDATRKLLVGVTVVGLAVDAVVHLHNARPYDVVGTTITEGWLFRIEAVAAIVVLVALLVRPSRLTAGAAAVVAGGGALAILISYYVHVGAIGPIPDMYEQTMFPEKALALVAQAVAAATAVTLVVIGFPTERAARPALAT